jgi:hypothetical protein
MMPGMTRTGISATNRAIAQGEPNHRQQLALERIEFAVAELATALISSCRSHGVAGGAIRDIRMAVGPALADILAVD